MQTQPPISRIFLISLTLTLVQLCFALIVRGAHPLESYQALYQWDSKYYREIAQNGYFSNVDPDVSIDTIDEEKFNHMTNVAFFPGYPLAGKLLWKLTGWPMQTVMLLTAQLFAVAFWMYFLLLLFSLAIPRRIIGASTAAMIAHPASFFLITAYSESIFLTMLLGYIFWSNREGTKARVMMVLHGFWMTLTRIHGLFAIAYPLLRNGRHQRIMRILIAGVASLGVAAFFGYSAWKFGHWDLYMQRQWHGWGIQPDYLFLFKGYLHVLPLNDRGFFDPRNISPLVATVMFFVFLITPFIEWYRRTHGDRDGWKTRVPLYITAFILWYFYASALATNDMRSFVRYALAPHALLLIAYAHLATRLRRPSKMIRIAEYAAGAILLVAMIALQASFIATFMDGDWVA